MEENKSSCEAKTSLLVLNITIREIISFVQLMLLLLLLGKYHIHRVRWAGDKPNLRKKMLLFYLSRTDHFMWTDNTI